MTVMTKEQRDVIGKALRHARERAGLSQTKAGEAAGLARADERKCSELFREPKP